VAILRVAIEPQKSSDIAALSRGLQILNQADAHVEILGNEENQIFQDATLQFGVSFSLALNLGMRGWKTLTGTVK
jgi:hypothetical protein